MSDARTRPAFAIAVGLTAWLAGLLLALVFGMVSAYVVVSVGFVGSRAWSRLRAEALGSGDR